MKTVYFVARLPAAARTARIVDLTESAADPEAADPTRQYISLAPLYAAHAREWKQLFVDWLGAINRGNASLDWWAYTSSAKNLLSSTLGNDVFQSLALLEVVTTESFDALYVIGASAAQVRFLRRRLGGNSAYRLVAPSAWFAPVRDLAGFALRLAAHAGRIWLATLMRPRALQAPKPRPDICLFTYFDAKSPQHGDAYFGQLDAQIAKCDPACSVVYTGFVHGDLRAALSRLAGISSRRCWPLVLETRLADLTWAAAKSVAALDVGRHLPANAQPDASALQTLLTSALRRDVTGGGYFHALLVYRAAIRFGGRFAPAHVIYPFENKSIEKMLLLGLRAACPAIRLTGYQHTSITPRHTTFLLAAGEAAATPLPDRVITVGAITRNYLEQHGSYPARMFQTGCALRQTWTDLPAVTPDRARRPRLLLALSSSVSELVRSVIFFRALMEKGGCELAIRPHPEFPLSRLPPSLAAWVSRNARDFSGTRLADNLEWCDLTAYVSSTVALETLMAGKPVVNFSIGDVLQPDPVLGDAPLCWRVATPHEFARVLGEIAALGDAEFRQASAAARAYVRDYLRPVSDACIAGFLGRQCGKSA